VRRAFDEPRYTAILMSDPTHPRDYAFTAGLTREQWAWEFLRRNPDYRRDWAAFDATWRDLEAVYGRPPNRDFTAWKQDPRAWVHVSECPEGECRVDQDKVLIECALGARWGFHKFPPDPADDDPVGGGRLTWRERPADQALELGPGDGAWLGADRGRVALGFDLRLPLRDQIEQAKRHLQMAQRQRVRDGSVVPASVAGLRDCWTRCLRLLDAESPDPAAPAPLEELAGEWSAAWLLAEAHRLRDGGYLDILRLPEA